MFGDPFTREEGWERLHTGLDPGEVGSQTGRSPDLPTSRPPLPTFGLTNDTLPHFNMFVRVSTRFRLGRRRRPINVEL